MIRRFILRSLVNFLGLWTAAELLGSRIDYGSQLQVLAVAAIVFSLVNAIIRPIIVIFSLPVIVLTLGLFTFVVNAFMLYLVTVFYPRFQVHSFWAAIGAAVVIWIVNYLLTDLLEPKRATTI